MKKPVEWLYRPANISATEYNSELMDLLLSIVPDLATASGRRFQPVDHDMFMSKCPELVKKLDQWGLKDRLSEVAIIWVNQRTHFGIHRDFPSWRARNIALNLPIINCEDSYTVWYDALLADRKSEAMVHLDATYGDSSYIKHTQAVEDESQAKEIGRIDSSKSYWVNVYQPHAPLVEHKKFRAIISIRFHPELFDVMASGQFDREFVEHD